MKKFFIFLSVLFICPLLIGCSNDEEKLNKKEEVKSEKETSIFQEQTKEGIVFKNVSFETTKDGTTVVTEVSNKDKDAREIILITLELKDKDDNLVEALSSYVGKKLEPGESVQTTAVAGIDLSSAVKVDYHIQ